MHLVSHALEVQTGKKVISFDVVIKYYYRILLLSNVVIVANIVTIFEGSDRLKISEQRLYLVVNDWLVPSHKNHVTVGTLWYIFL